MSTAVVERLDSLVTKDPPPCEAMIYADNDRPCGRPSAYRIKRECACGVKSTKYLCDRCYFDLMTGGIHCHFCLRPVTSWVLA